MQSPQPSIHFISNQFNSYRETKKQKNKYFSNKTKQLQKGKKEVYMYIICMFTTCACERVRTPLMLMLLVFFIKLLIAIKQFVYGSQSMVNRRLPNHSIKFPCLYQTLQYPQKHLIEQRHFGDDHVVVLHGFHRQLQEAEYRSKFPFEFVLLQLPLQNDKDEIR